MRVPALTGSVFGLAIVLAACTGTNNAGRNGPIAEFSAAAPVTPVQSQPLDGTNTTDQIGTGPIRIALILPLTQASGPSVIGASLRNAAELALAEGGSNDVTLLIKDDHSTPDGARAAVQAALSEGAELVLGPVFAPNVREAGRVARGAGKPMIAFSSDTSTAGTGSYLLSFPIEGYVDRIVDYAASKGKKSIAALIPDSDYGRISEAQLQQAAARRGLRVLTIEHYQPQTMAPAVQKIAALGGQIDTLFIPEQTEATPAVAQALAANGLDGKRVQILGTGQWNDPRVQKLPALQGAWFAAAETEGFNAFAQKYRGKFGTDPQRLATTGYDAVTLAVALARTQGSQRYSEGVLTNTKGFIGTDGFFRFRPDGQIDRGLAVFQIKNGFAAPISQAPRSITSASAN